mmetsp:Transcript_51063/g.136191  ORF Transcript_51063/g.136191 Transcript_51063/m.136191 type:complete len:213 (-) Transcript_51063:193-831(-)
MRQDKGQPVAGLGNRHGPGSRGLPAHGLRATGGPCINHNYGFWERDDYELQSRDCNITVRLHVALRSPTHRKRRQSDLTPSSSAHLHSHSGRWLSCEHWCSMLMSGQSLHEDGGKSLADRLAAEASFLAGILILCQECVPQLSQGPCSVERHPVNQRRNNSFGCDCQWLQHRIPGRRSTVGTATHRAFQSTAAFASTRFSSSSSPQSFRFRL